MVTGRLHSFSWRDSEENPHSLLEVQARSLQVLERADSSSETEEAILEQAGDEEEDFVLEAA
jgi:single-stranded DNA-binding protein